MKYIHKIIFITILTIISVPSYAGIKMCSANDTVTVVLDPSISLNYNGNSGYSAVSAWRWKFSYGTVRGRSACLSDTKGLGGTGAVYTGVLRDNDKLVVGGEQNGGKCFCRITHPVASKWIYASDYGTSVTSCASRCAGACANYYTYRDILFNSAN